MPATSAAPSSRRRWKLCRSYDYQFSLAMQFVANGPDIPDSLLQAHEEGRVVFFCGAGISYPAGLPGFRGLVDEIYRLVGTTPNAIEKEAYERSQFDATLDLLERRLPRQRLDVRMALVEALQPNLRRKGATDTHAALLQLGRGRDKALRLVTTNFDHVFRRVASRDKQRINAYAAPMLPIPKNSRWNGLVYLHGLLPEDGDASELNRLVVTSGDFGLAYLTERWAARFVSELFRNYVVCFVGYSINDPVLRYMMDALAADRMLGEITPEAYALGDCEPGQESQKTVEWEAKGVSPILYGVPIGSHDHSALHRTLKAWAETHRDGILGKERIVVDYAMTRPSVSTRQDDFVGRMLWALSDESGLPAKRFADFNPVPTLDWLKAFSDDRYRHGDLIRFRVPPHTESNDKLRFSLINRPAPYTLAPWMALTSGGATDCQWDEVLFHLARWLVRHLDDPALIIWLAQRRGRLHGRLEWLIEHELDRFATLEHEGNTTELARIRADSPNAVPRLILRPLWRLLLTGRVKFSNPGLELYRWKDRFKREGLTATLRFDLRKRLAPKICLKKPFSWPVDISKTGNPERLEQLVEWELVLAADHVHASLEDLTDDAKWQSALPALLDDFQQLLRDALDLLRDLDKTPDRSSCSHWHLPSISPHWQNRGFYDWVILIELLRDSWLAVREVDPVRARQVAQGWFAAPYSTFKRLALFAASHKDCIAPEHWVDWLQSDDAWWIWSDETSREVLRLLASQGQTLLPDMRERLESSILAGPPRKKYHLSLAAEEWERLVSRSVWLRLAKLRSCAADLGAAAETRWQALTAEYPRWRLAKDNSDEFSHWMSGTGDPDFEEGRNVELAPRTRNDLVIWLQRSSGQQIFEEDNWGEICRTRFYLCAFALCDLAKEGQWHAGRWSTALQAWSDETKVERSWRFIAPLVNTMPDNVLIEVAPAFTWWLEVVSKSVSRHEEILLELCRRTLNVLHIGEMDSGEPIARAINHPVGHVTQALLNLWFRRAPNDNDGLPIDLEPFFTRLCDTGVDQFRHGRVLLASRLIALFRVDRTWTEVNLLPLFNWLANPAEASAVWRGFLWAPRLYRPLLIAFKSSFLDTSNHYAELGDHSKQFAAFLTYAALEPVDSYSIQDFRAALGVLPQKGLNEAAEALARALEGSGDRREEFWINRVQPFWQNIWPKSRQLASQEISASLARLSLAAGNQFPNALFTVQGWLQRIEHPDYVVHRAQESGLCTRFPKESLKLLESVVPDQMWVHADLRLCLQAIVQANPELHQDVGYRRLDVCCRQKGV